jgi:hypothetical protein
MRRSEGSLSKRGARWAALRFPEHTQQSYEAGVRMGIVECDTTFTKDGELATPTAWVYEALGRPDGPCKAYPLQIPIVPWLRGARGVRDRSEKLPVTAGSYS